MRTDSGKAWRGVRALMIVLLLPSALAACGRPGADAMVPVVAQAPGATDHTILIATTRQRTAIPGAMFNGERARELDYAEAVVSVPPNHVSGRIEFPSQPPGNPNTDFVTREASYLDSEKQFVASLNQQLAQRPPGHRNVLLFIHGYNTKFPEGVYRLAQITHDSKSEAVPVHFSWASRGELVGYVYDQNSATVARDGLEHVLRLIAQSNVEKINLVAHSMGNWVTVEAFRNIAISKEFPRGKMGAIILAAPDIDVDVFRSQMARIGRPKKPFLIVLSRDDRALALSRFIAGDESRLGDYKNAADLTKYNAIVVDLTDVQGLSPINHDKFAELAMIAPQLKEVLAEGVGNKETTPVDQAATTITSPVQNAPDVVKTVLSLPMSVVAAPIVIIARQAQ